MATGNTKKGTERNAECESLCQMIVELIAELVDKKKELREWKDTNAGLTHDLMDARVSCRNLAQRAGAAEIEAWDAKQKHDYCSKKLTEALLENATLRTVLDTVTAEKLKLQDANADHINTIQVQDARIEDMRKMLKMALEPSTMIPNPEVVKRSTELQKHINALVLEHNKLMAEQVEEKKALAELRSKYGSLQYYADRANRAYTERLEHMRFLLSAADKEMAAQMAQLVAKTEELRVSDEKRAALNDELKVVRQKIKELSTALVSWTVTANIS